MAASERGRLPVVELLNVTSERHRSEISQTEGNIQNLSIQILYNNQIYIEGKEFKKKQSIYKTTQNKRTDERIKYQNATT